MRVRVGDLEIVSILDVQGGYPLAFVFPETPPEAWDAYREIYVDTFDGDKVNLAVDTYAIIGGGHTILVDTGLGQVSPMEAILLRELAVAGIDPAAVDTVIHTHLHGDHVGWNFAGGKATFPNARHVAQQLDYNHFAASNDDSFRAQVKPLSDAGRLDLVSGEKAFSDTITLVPTPGHTPGHQSVVVSSGGESIFITGDIAHHPAQAHETSWTDTFDVDKEAAKATRAALFQRFEAEGTLAALCHFPNPGFGRMVRKNGRRVFQAL